MSTAATLCRAGISGSLPFLHPTCTAGEHCNMNRKDSLLYHLYALWMTSTDSTCWSIRSTPPLTGCSPRHKSVSRCRCRFCPSWTSLNSVYVVCRYQANHLWLLLLSCRALYLTARTPVTVSANFNLPRAMSALARFHAGISGSLPYLYPTCTAGECQAGTVAWIERTASYTTCTLCWSPAVTQVVDP